MEKVVPNRYPWLMFDDDENQIFYDLVSETRRTSFSRSVSLTASAHTGKFVRRANHGWLLFLGGGQLCLWNPATLQSIFLPSLSMDLKSVDIAFLTKPDISEPNCGLLLFLHDRPSIMFCYINDQTWTERCYSEELEEIDGIHQDQKLVNLFLDPIACDYDDSILVSTSRSGSTAKIEIVKPRRLVIRPLRLQHRPRPTLFGPDSESECRRRSQMVGFCGDLFLIDIAYGGVGRDELTSAVLFKFDFSNKVWNTVDNCPNAAFFLEDEDREPAICCSVDSADSTKAGNLIYISQFKTKRLYTFHIKHKTLSVSLLPRSSASPSWILIPDAKAKAKQDHLVADNNNDVENRVITKVDDLPFDILRLITSHLNNPVDYLNFRTVNKLCRFIAGCAKQWRVDNNSIQFPSSTSSPSPWLMIPSVDEGLLGCMVDPWTQNKYYITRPETWKKDTRIAYAQDGWLLMCTEYDDDDGHRRQHLELYNPLTKSTICFPDPPHRMNHFYCTYSSESDWVVVGLLCGLEPKQCSIDSVYNTEWYEEDLIPLSDKENHLQVEQSNAYPVLSHTEFYLLGENGATIGLVRRADDDEDDDQNSVLEVKHVEVLVPCRSFEHNFLAECCGVVLSVYIGKNWEWVRVFRLKEVTYKDRSVWIEVKMLCNYNIYYSRVSCVSMLAESHAMGNRIYFPRFVGDSVLYYSLLTSRFHLHSLAGSTHDPPLMSGLYDSKEELYSCWFQPSFNCSFIQLCF